MPGCNRPGVRAGRRDSQRHLCVGNGWLLPFAVTQIGDCARPPGTTPGTGVLPDILRSSIQSGEAPGNAINHQQSTINQPPAPKASTTRPRCCPCP